MIYVGIDVASTKHDIVILNELGQSFKKAFSIRNDLDGYKKLLSEISSAKEFFNDSNVRIGLESTGHYSRNILHFLILARFEVMFINPLLTNMDRTMMFSLGGTKEEFESFISKAVEDINILSWNNEYRPTETILDGEEWKITIHIENDEDIEIFGINAYPDNFADFIILCTEFNFGPYELVDNEASYDLGVEEWYDDFLEEIEELESKLLCPKCSSDYMVHTDPMGYTFLCGDCGNQPLFTWSLRTIKYYYGSNMERCGWDSFKNRAIMG